MKKVLFLLMLPVSSGVFAHGGHSALDPYSLWHYLLTAEHALPLLVILLAGALLYRRYHKQPLT